MFQRRLLGTTAAQTPRHAFLNSASMVSKIRTPNSMSDPSVSTLTRRGLVTPINQADIAVGRRNCLTIELYLTTSLDSTSSAVVSKFDELFDSFQNVHGAHDCITRHLSTVLLMRDHHEVDRVGVVQFVGVADDLLQFLCETA